MSSAHLRTIQSGLQGLGHDPGPVDGLWGRGTRNAVQSLLDHNGMPLSVQRTGRRAVHQDVIKQGRAGYEVRKAILHTSATPSDWWRGKTVEQMRDEIDRWHRQRGFRMIGYHGVIAPDGSFAPGRDYDQIGAHVKEANRGTVGFCMVPVKEVTRIGAAIDWYTNDTIQAVKVKLAELAQMTPLQKVDGHNEYTNKLCPGFHVDDEFWLSEVA